MPILYKCDNRAGASPARHLHPTGRTGNTMHRITCKGCDVQFVALRSDAVTCSPRCRKRYQRQCDQITADMIAAKVLGAGQKAYPKKKGVRK